MVNVGQYDGAAEKSAQMAQPASTWPLRTLLERFDIELAAGSAETTIRGVCSLEHGGPDYLAYAGDSAHLAALQATNAGVVIVPEDLVEQAHGVVLVASQPQLQFARIAALFEYRGTCSGVHASAVVHPEAQVGAHVEIGPHAVVGAGCSIGDSTHIGANTVIGDYTTIGERGLIGSNVSIGHHTRIGKRVRIAPNATIGARGFGLVHSGSGWETIPQLGAVVLGDDVEVGASTTIDRGALDDTVIDDDVRVDNQVQIGHNCHIGAHTVIAGSSGIAGSSSIGANCLIGGAVCIGDHIRVADGVMITGASQVPHDITEPGAWSSTFRAMPAGQWRKLLARFRRLGHLHQRLRRLEKRMEDL